MSSGLKLDRRTRHTQRRRMNIDKEKKLAEARIGTTAGKIDEMLLDGATIDQMAKKAKTTKATVSVHLTHLRKEHKLTIVKKEGVLRYDVDGVNGKKIVGKKSRKSD